MEVKNSSLEAKNDGLRQESHLSPGTCTTCAKWQWRAVPPTRATQPTFGVCFLPLFADLEITETSDNVPISAPDLAPPGFELSKGSPGWQGCLVNAQTE